MHNYIHIYFIYPMFMYHIEFLNEDSLILEVKQLTRMIYYLK